MRTAEFPAGYEFLKRGRILTFRGLLAFSQNARKEGLTIATTCGHFDILHPGTVYAVARTVEMADRCIVLVNSNKSTRKIKGRGRPIMHDGNRAEMVAALRGVDAVYVFDELTPSRILRIIRPAIHVKDETCRIGKMPEAESVKKYGGKIVLVKRKRAWSTAKIIDRCMRAGGWRL